MRYHDPIAADIARVVKSVSQTFRARGWEVEVVRSPKSRSRYVHAKLDKRRMVVRVSDHRPNKNARYDLDYSPQYYDQKNLADKLDKRKKSTRKRDHRKGRCQY